MDIQNLILLLLRGFSLALLARAILSWLPSTGVFASLSQVARVITEPVLAPIRRLLPAPRLGGVSFDLSIVAALLAVQLLTRVVVTA